MLINKDKLFVHPPHGSDPLQNVIVVLSWPILHPPPRFLLKTVWSFLRNPSEWQTNGLKDSTKNITSWAEEIIKGRSRSARNCGVPWWMQCCVLPADGAVSLQLDRLWQNSILGFLIFLTERLQIENCTPFCRIKSWPYLLIKKHIFFLSWGKWHSVLLKKKEIHFFLLTKETLSAVKWVSRPFHQKPTATIKQEQGWYVCILVLKERMFIQAEEMVKCSVKPLSHDQRQNAQHGFKPLNSNGESVEAQIGSNTKPGVVHSSK